MNGRNYSVHPDGSGQERGNTSSRTCKSSSINTHLEDARVAPHSPGSVPTTFDINSEPELIQGNVFRAEPFTSGSNRNIYVPVQKLVQSSQGRGVETFLKPLAGGHELVLKHQEIYGSGEYHRALGSMESLFLQGKVQKDKQLFEEPKSFIHRPEETVGNDLSFGERRPSGLNQLQSSSQCVQKKPKGPQKKKGGPKNNPGNGKGNANKHRPYPQSYRIPKLDPLAVDSVFDMARTLMEFTSKEKERMNRTFPCK
ncbi:hypothetical protein O181_036272 [Austropuccinia psidii MF-1]|uniref:Uncharacterized protein n=1 Tax=Austropuccinia psidii MF-1 TaxID=1389203 RepID=A0A9Q3H9R9_9BASI|nr:hypothetical protein [Austropuccinia psidii MF-1]